MSSGVQWGNDSCPERRTRKDVALRGDISGVGGYGICAGVRGQKHGLLSQMAWGPPTQWDPGELLNLPVPGFFSIPRRLHRDTYLRE